MVTDPIADMLVRLMNAGRAKKESALIPYSLLKETVLEILSRDGFVGGLLRRGRKNKRRLEVSLLYGQGEQPVIQGCRRVSRPGRRFYMKAREIRAPKDGRGVLVLSTPQGILTHREAKKRQVGGEVLFEIW